MDYNDFQPVEDMSEVTHIFKKIFDDKKFFSNETTTTGFFAGSPLVARIEGNRIQFAMPFCGALSMLRDILEKNHYNKTDSIMVTCEVNDDNTMLTATFYSKEFKLFKDL